MAGGTAKDIIRAERKKQREWSKKWRKENDAIFNEYMAQVGAGKMEEDFFPALCERFGCTPRRIRNVLSRRSGSLNDKTRTLTEAQLVVALQSMVSDLDTAKREYDDQLVELEALEGAGERFVSTKMVESTGGKFGFSASEDKISIWEYRAKIYERITKLHDSYWSAVGRVLPKRLEIQSRDITSVSDEELAILDEEIAAKSGEISVEEKG